MERSVMVNVAPLKEERTTDKGFVNHVMHNAAFLSTMEQFGAVGCDANIHDEKHSETSDTPIL